VRIATRRVDHAENFGGLTLAHAVSPAQLKVNDYAHVRTLHYR
jgi:hypothetical protein